MAEKELQKDHVPHADASGTARAKRPEAWVIWVTIVGFVVLIALVVAAIIVAHIVNDNRTLSDQNRTTMTAHGRFGRDPWSSYYEQTTSTNGPTTTTTTTRYTVTQGVVSKVNSNSIVVVGNGQSQTITTNSSTTYTNGTKPAVNDTVQIIGTADSSDNVTANTVTVENY